MADIADQAGLKFVFFWDSWGVASGLVIDFTKVFHGRVAGPAGVGGEFFRLPFVGGGQPTAAGEIVHDCGDRGSCEQRAGWDGWIESIRSAPYAPGRTGIREGPGGDVVATGGDIGHGQGWWQLAKRVGDVPAIVAANSVNGVGGEGERGIA
jgi:hypothetical protein